MSFTADEKSKEASDLTSTLSSTVEAPSFQVMSPKLVSSGVTKERLAALEKSIKVDSLTKETNFSMWSNLFLSVMDIRGCKALFASGYTDPTGLDASQFFLIHLGHFWPTIQKSKHLLKSY